MTADTTNPWSGKRILITGVCGTVGGELLRQVSRRDPVYQTYVSSAAICSELTSAAQGLVRG